MRAEDINNIKIMKRRMADGGLRITGQLADGTDIAHIFYDQDANGGLRQVMRYISRDYRHTDLAQRLHAMAVGQQQIDEISLGKLAKAAAIGAGVLGTTYLGRSTVPPPPPVTLHQPTQSSTVVQPTGVDKSPSIATIDDLIKRSDVPAVATSPVKPMDTEAKVARFLDEIVPLVKAENARLSRDRQAVIRTVSKIHRGAGLNPKETQWLQSMMDSYGTSDPMELIQKVDIVPNSMAVAQAAIESGWGQDPLAQKANVIFGQKTWDKDSGVAGPQGERYAAFSSPADSVRAYMQNLNTHPAYEKFRATRAGLRAQNKPVTGQMLLPTITKYSTLGKDYVAKVNKVIKGRNLHKLDH